MKLPDICLGANVAKIQMVDGCEVWSTSPRHYITNAIKVIERLLDEDQEGYALKSNVNNPISMNYKPELDVTDELDEKLASRYLQLIAILRWAVELGRIDIFQEVSILSQCQANPKSWAPRGSLLYPCILEEAPRLRVVGVRFESPAN
jgi:hypothetical protein